jgi:L-amino acid N-acyltransferase YncA
MVTEILILERRHDQLLYYTILPAHISDDGFNYTIVFIFYRNVHASHRGHNCKYGMRVIMDLKE